MTAAPRKPFAVLARAAWDGAPPDWIVILAEEVDRQSQTAVAKRLGYSSSVVSQALANRYGGDMTRVEHAVRGALMGATVMCPVLDEIPRDMCLEEQRMPAAATSGMRMRLARACKFCPHRRGEK